MTTSHAQHKIKPYEPKGKVIGTHVRNGLFVIAAGIGSISQISYPDVKPQLSADNPRSYFINAILQSYDGSKVKVDGNSVYKEASIAVKSRDEISEVKETDYQTFIPHTFDFEQPISFDEKVTTDFSHESIIKVEESDYTFGATKTLYL